MRPHHLVVIAAALSIPAAWAQQAQQTQQPAPAAKTTEQQARSYILSAFMTGAAPAVVSDSVKVAPALRLRLALPAESDSRAVYYALVKLTAGKSLTVRPAKIDELDMTDTQVEPGKPVFALDVSESTFVLQYDLERDSVMTIADASRPVAVTAPVTAPEPPQPNPEAATPAAEAAPAAPAPAIAAPAESAKPAETAEPAKPAEAAASPAEAAAPPAAAIPPATAAPEAAKTTVPEPAPAPGAKVQVVEPREPRLSKPAAAAAPAKPAAIQVTREQPRLPPLKPNGACVIKPVMSDQDLVNCGATPR